MIRNLNNALNAFLFTYWLFTLGFMLFGSYTPSRFLIETSIFITSLTCLRWLLEEWK